MSKQIDHSGNDRLVARVRRRAQRLAFASLYRFGGPIYDGLTTLLFGGAWIRWRRAVKPFLSEGPVLDLGCGTGVLVGELAELGITTVGVDRERSMLARANRLPGARGRLIRADAHELPFMDGSFSTVIATFPAQFILEQRSLDEIARVLRTGGVVAVTLTGQTEEKTWWRWPIRLMLRVFYGASQAPAYPRSTPLAHKLLDGQWRWVEQGRDRVLLWTAVRVLGRETSIPTSPG